LIKNLLRVVKVLVTWGVKSLPPLKKSRPEIYERRGSTRNDEVCIDRDEKRISQPSEGGKFLGLPSSLNFHAWVT
jgi:hypothetical protein